MRILTKDELLEIFYEMGGRVGCPKSFFDPFKNGKRMPKNWFWKYSWTEKEETDFRAWLARYLKRKLGMSLKYWQRKCAWLISDVGWETKEVE